MRLGGRGVVVNAVHPGLVANTGLLKETRGPFKWVTDTFGSTPEKGADTVLWLATPRSRNRQRKAVRQAQGDPDARSGFGPRRAQAALGGKRETHEWQRAVDIVIGDSIPACPEVAATRGRATVMSGYGRRAVGHPAHNQH